MKRNQGKKLRRSRGKEENQLSVVCRKPNGKKYFKEEKMLLVGQVNENREITIS